MRKTRKNIVGLELRVTGEDLLFGPTSRQEIDDQLCGDPLALNTRFPDKDLRVHGYVVTPVHGLTVIKTESAWAWRSDKMMKGEVRDGTATTGFKSSDGSSIIGREARSEAHQRRKDGREIRFAVKRFRWEAFNAINRTNFSNPDRQSERRCIRPDHRFPGVSCNSHCGLNLGLRAQLHYDYPKEVVVVGALNGIGSTAKCTDIVVYRDSVNRLLDPGNDSVTLNRLQESPTVIDPGNVWLELVLAIDKADQCTTMRECFDEYRDQTLGLSV